MFRKILFIGAISTTSFSVSSYAQSNANAFVQLTESQIQQMADNATTKLADFQVAEPPAISKQYVRSAASYGEYKKETLTGQRFKKNYAGISYSFCVIAPNEVTITGHSIPLGVEEVEMPSQITYEDKTYNVVAIGLEGMTFLGSVYHVAKVVFPEKLRRIGEKGLKGWSFRSITIPNTVEEIGDYAFSQAKNLEEVYIPASVKKIGYAPFKSCYKLKAINVDPDNPNYTSVDGVLYNKDMTELIQFPSNRSMFAFVVPNTVVSINREAFAGDAKINFVFLPNGLRYVGIRAFDAPGYITNVILPASVEEIGSNAFYGINGAALRNLFVLSPIPPKVNKVFNNPYLRVIVPKGSRSKYLEADGWSSVPKITETEYIYPQK